MKAESLSRDGEGDQRFFDVLIQMWALHVKKGQDYGTDDDFLANLRASEGFGIPAWVGALVRQNDKLIRLRNAAQGKSLANESVEDSLIDNCCYAVLALVLYRETAHASSELMPHHEAADFIWQLDGVRQDEKTMLISKFNQCNPGSFPGDTEMLRAWVSNELSRWPVDG